MSGLFDEIVQNEVNQIHNQFAQDQDRLPVVVSSLLIEKSKTARNSSPKNMGLRGSIAKDTNKIASVATKLGRVEVSSEGLGDVVDQLVEKISVFTVNYGSGDSSSAHEAASKIQMRGGRSVRIDKKNGKWVITYAAEKKISTGFSA